MIEETVAFLAAKGAAWSSTPSTSLTATASTPTTR